MTSRRPPPVPASGRAGLDRALDEAHFGADRILNLRESLPTPAQAEARAEAWLRERQVARAGEVLVITGRGNLSHDGVSVVREAVVKLLASLGRRGVVSSMQEHTPGSFVVRLASLRALRAAPRRTRERARVPKADPEALRGLEPETRELLRDLALRALEELGARDPAHFLEAEMLAQFTLIAAGVPEGADRERRLRAALQAALAEYD